MNADQLEQLAVIFRTMEKIMEQEELYLEGSVTVRDKEGTQLAAAYLPDPGDGEDMSITLNVD